MAPGKRRKDDDEEFEAPAPKASRDSPEVSRKLKYQVQITGLNQQYAAWVASQLANNPQMLWVPGAKDYIKHVEKIQQEFKDVLDAARQFPSGHDDNGDHAVGTGGASSSGWGAGGSSGNGSGWGSGAGFGGSGARSGGAFGLPPPSFGTTPAASTESARVAFGNYNGPFGATTTEKATGAAAQPDSRGEAGDGGQRSTGTTTTPTPSFFGLGSAQTPAASGPSSAPAFGSFHFKSTTTEATPASAAAHDSTTTQAMAAPFGSTGTTMPAFGATAATTFGASSAPAFGSLTSSTTAAPTFGSTAPPAFSLAGTAPTSGTTAVPAFGSTSASTFGTGTTPAFGSAAASAFGASTTPAFGAPAAAQAGADAAGKNGADAAAASTGAAAAPSTSIWPVITGGAFSHANDTASASTTAAAAAEAAATASKGSEGKGSEGSTSAGSTKTLFNFGAKSAMPQPTFGPTAGGFAFSWPGSTAAPATGADAGALGAAAANPEEGEEEGPQKYESEVEINQDSGTVHFKAKSKFFVMKESAWEMMGVGQLMVRSPVPNPDTPNEPAKSPFITFTTEGGRVLFCANLYKNMKLIINEAKNTVSWAAPWKPPGAKEGGSALSNVMAQLPKGHYSKISEEITKLQAAMA